ncbi:fimbrial protein [Buttiauxella selenatireducens]|uniref:Fimbrial protein n=1 Tax=Buttiauxella selenatireducens TaxID=3073902 RepID=A0ABY9S623_9ENTR|nr:fimbrial protein [Buttiauxella sp. R73]WMY72964.1 fimbrial protein [Buttiauxella sp. R73]
MKKIIALLVIVLGYATNGFAAADKVCYPSSGTPGKQNFTIAKTLTKEENMANAVLVDKESTTSSGSVSFTCDCTSPNTSVSHWWSTQGMFPYTSSNGYSWQQLSPFLAASVELYIYNSGGNNMHAVPFTGISNKVSEKCGMSGSAASGSRGTVSIKIIKPAVGQINFNGTVAKMWHYRKANYINPADPVEMMVNLNLNITVPEGCTLLAGSTLNIDLGSQTRQTQFVGQPYPEPPTSYTPRAVNLQFDCDFANAALDVVLSGNADDQGQGFATSSPDVSVIVTDSNGSIIPPNTEAGKVNVGLSTITDTLKLKAYPTNSGSEVAPNAAPYTATATILLTYE